MNKRLIYADDAYDKILELIEKKKSGNLYDPRFIEGLTEALDIIESTKTIEWR